MRAYYCHRQAEAAFLIRSFVHYIYGFLRASWVIVGHLRPINLGAAVPMLHPFAVPTSLLLLPTLLNAETKKPAKGASQNAESTTGDGKSSWCVRLEGRSLTLMRAILVCNPSYILVCMALPRSRRCSTMAAASLFTCAGSADSSASRLGAA